MRRFLKITLVSLAVMVVLLLSVTVGLYYSALSKFKAPPVSIELSDYPLTQWSDSLRICGSNYLLLNPDGLWEARISGSALERGAVLGLMSKDILQNQERVFVDQIHQLIPSERYIRILHKFIAIFNRNMAQHIPTEYLEEIYAMSLSCSKAYDAYGTPYARQLNYHAAHDIGHTMQEYMLVGCSSFAAWGKESADGGLIVGRNFDFYVGDDFAKNKIVLFVNPDSGYKYASVTWPGMMGVVSGMNECGLAVTINAAKGAVPTSTAMPISLLVRHILQHAENIDEAMDIAKTCQTFVSESILVASARDKRAAVIEKTPKETLLYTADATHIICTNHYQSDFFADNKYNVDNIAASDSKYRFDRLSELIDCNTPLDAQKSVGILRNRYGLHNEDIGLTNEKSINQFIAHHSVVFDPEKLKMWVSTSPWQCGAFLCYDLNEAFASDDAATCSVAIAHERIPADSLFLRYDLKRVEAFRRQTAELRQAMDKHIALPRDFISLYIDNNPNCYLVYDMAGDYELTQDHVELAKTYWELALTKEIPHQSTRRNIEKKLKRHDKK